MSKEFSPNSTQKHDLAAFSRTLARWAYETAFIPTQYAGHATTTKQTLAEFLNGQDTKRLSPWWTSLLYERHPAMTPELFTIYTEIWQKTTQSPTRFFHLHLWGKALYRHLLAAIQPGIALLRFIHWLWTVYRLLQPTKLAAMQKDSDDTPYPITVVAYFPACDKKAAEQGLFRSLYWENLHSLLDTPPTSAIPEGLTAGGVHWLFVRIRTPGENLDAHLALRDTFRATAPKHVSLHFMEEFLSWKAIARAVYRFLHIMFASWQVENIFQHACILRDDLGQPYAASTNFYPLVKTVYAASFRGWRGLERCLLDEAICEFSRQAGPQRLTLFPQENCPWERMLTHALRQHVHAGPIIGAQHSTVRPADFRYIDDRRTFTDPACCLFQPDIFALNGSHSRKILRSFGMPKERYFTVEALRYQKKIKSIPPIRPCIYKESTLPKGKSTPLLLMLTGFFAKEVTFHIQLLAECLRVGLFQNWQIIFKGHPWRDPRAEVLTLCPNQELISFSSAPLAQLFALQPMLVWTSNSTTAAVDVAYAHLPLLVTAPEQGFDMSPLSALKNLPRAASITHVAAALTNPRPISLPQHWLYRETDLYRWKKLLFRAAHTYRSETLETS